jgi:hypothetical protein
VRLLRLLVAAALLAGAAPAVASEARALVVTGSTTGYATFQVDRRVVLDLRGARVVRTGRYGGIAFDDHGFVLSSDDIPVTVSRGQVDVTHRLLRLEPGRTYRVYLMTPGARTTVTVPWDAPHRQVTVTTEHDVQVRVENRTVAERRAVTIPALGGPPGTRVYGLAMVGSTWPVPHRVTVRACLARAVDGCDPVGWGISATGLMGPASATTASFGVVGADSRGYNVVGLAEGAGPTDTFTVVALRYAVARPPPPRP